MRHAVIDRWLGAILMAVAAIWSGLVQTTVSAERMEGAPGPRAFPMLLGEILFALGAIMIVLSLPMLAGAVTDEPQVEPAPREEIAIVGGGIAVFLLYAFLMDKIGFLLATPLIVMVTLRVVLGVRGWVRIVAVAIALTIGCDLVFADLLQANLPQGDWISLGGF